MIFWILAGLMTATVVAAVLWPLLRSRASARRAADYDIEVYRDQLAEVERNLERGQIGESEAEAARTEIGRRILAADQRRQAADPGTGIGVGPRRALAAVLAITVPAGTIALYLDLGSPGMESRPFAERDVKADETQVAGNGGESGGNQGRAQDLAQAEQDLAARLSENPDDAQGWLLLGRTRMAMGRYEGAAEAFRRVRTLRPDDPNVAAMYGEALVMAAGGTVTQKAEAALSAAAESRPGDPRTRYYLALAELQKGNAEKALNQWAGMVEEAPAAAPWLDTVRRQMAAAEEQLGREPGRAFAEVAPEEPADDTGAGPTREQMRAAQDMSPEERRQMVRGMVDGLAAKLEENPRDFQGWQRLIRSYGVLGETEKAQDALETALETFENAPFVRQRLVAQARQQNLSVPEGPGNGASGDRNGPTREQMQAAADMSPEERRRMIAGMVDRLAKRLEDQPNDLEGWLMLGRSYRVLGQPAKARDAFAKAAELAPENVDVLSRYARAIRAAADDRQTDESYRVTRRILELAPDNPQALWFTALRHAAEGEKEKAREFFDKALANLPPDTPETAELRRRAEDILAN